jgi:hypothetical protein
MHWCIDGDATDCSGWHPPDFDIATEIAVNFANKGMR